MRLDKSTSPSALEQSTQQGTGLIWGSWPHAEPQLFLPICRLHLLFSWLPRTKQWHEAQSHVKTPQWLVLFCFHLNICILGSTFHKATMKTLGRGCIGQAFRKASQNSLALRVRKHASCKARVTPSASAVTLRCWLLPQRKGEPALSNANKTLRKNTVSITTTQELHHFLNV